MNLETGKPSIASSTERVKTWLEGHVLHIPFNNPARHNAAPDTWSWCLNAVAMANRMG